MSNRGAPINEPAPIFFNFGRSVIGQYLRVKVTVHTDLIYLCKLTTFFFCSAVREDFVSCRNPKVYQLTRMRRWSPLWILHQENQDPHTGQLEKPNSDSQHFYCSALLASLTILCLSSNGVCCSSQDIKKNMNSRKHCGMSPVHVPFPSQVKTAGMDIW